MEYLLNGRPYFPGTSIFGTGLFADGTAAAPSIAFAADSDTGFYRASSGNAVFSSNGAVSLYFGAGGTIQGAGFTGYLALPSSGAVSLFAAGTNQNITLTPSGTGVTNLIGNNVSPLLLTKGTGAGGIVFSFNGTTYLSSITTSEASSAANCYMDLGVATGNNTITQQVLRLTGNGRALIGTTTDSGALLQVGANAAAGIGGAGISFGGDNFLFRDSATTLRLNNSGTSQSLQLTHSAIAAAGLVINLSYGNASINNRENGALAFATNNVTAVTLDASQRTILSGALRLNHAYTAGVGAATGYLTVQDSTGTTYKIPVLA